MIQFEEAVIGKLILHRIAAEGNSVIGKSPIDYTDDKATVLKKIFLKPFLTTTQTFEFKHDVNIDYNILFNLARRIYSNDDFTACSENIAQHLISSSRHPNIKDGDVFIAKFDGVLMNNRTYAALGIYKFEDKEHFIETATDAGGVGMNVRRGIGNKKPDKACLILFSDEPYTLLVVDSNPNETDYWQRDFINHRPKNDDINNTNSFLTLTKNFITTQIQEDFEVTRTDQIDLLNRSVDYFKKRETFDKKEFEETVFGDPNVIESFRRFDKHYQQDHELDLSDSFDIASQVVKKQARIFKSVLKLDKNFHIYIHGSRELIEQGVDEKGRKYYKIYYEQEL